MKNNLVFGSYAYAYKVVKKVQGFKVPMGLCPRINIRSPGALCAPYIGTGAPWDQKTVSRNLPHGTLSIFRQPDWVPVGPLNKTQI